MSRRLENTIVKKNRTLRIIDSFPKSKVMILGDLMLDRYLWGSVERISPEAPVPVVHIEKETSNLGGAANVAANVSALGAHPFLVGVIGEDQFASELKKNLRGKRLPASGLVIDSKRPTTVKTRIVAHSQQVVRVDRENPAEIDSDLVDRLLSKAKSYLNQVDGILISDYGKGVITRELLAEIIPMAVSAGRFIAVDPKEIHFMNYKNVSVITPNHHEAGFVSGRKITNEKILTEVGWNLLKTLELESLLITRGEKGMTLFEKDGDLTHIPTEAKTVYDVTGAGDTVIAALSVARTAGACMKEAAYIANIAASLAVARFGTARITRDELLEVVNNKK
ncbi:MAG: D-glycero-beta-D-manno-heptose-7-phosphate kinase [Candidatus Zixiibacteriota bacterium]|nr:MAG: D-glycero-beta-D-manno-heptose-7-phosphate kinase [candidate division Zixibacteria bacterium]